MQMFDIFYISQKYKGKNYLAQSRNLIEELFFKEHVIGSFLKVLVMCSISTVHQNLHCIKFNSTNIKDSKDEAKLNVATLLSREQKYNKPSIKRL